MSCSLVNGSSSHAIVAFGIVACTWRLKTAWGPSPTPHICTQHGQFCAAATAAAAFTPAAFPPKFTQSSASAFAAFNTSAALPR